jgi:hypothetical protein
MKLLCYHLMDLLCSVCHGSQGPWWARYPGPFEVEKRLRETSAKDVGPSIWWLILYTHLNSYCTQTISSNFTNHITHWASCCTTDIHPQGQRSTVHMNQAMELLGGKCINSRNKALKVQDTNCARSQPNSRPGWGIPEGSLWTGCFGFESSSCVCVQEVYP